MTTIELRTSIVAELEQMSDEMLRSVQHYVKRLRRHSRPVSKVAYKEATPDITPRVMRFKRGKPWYVTDEEVDRLRHEYLMEKYK